MVKTKKSLAEQLAELSTTTPKDYDPEDMGGDSLQSKHNADSDMGSDDDGDNENAGREHYVNVGKSQLRSKQFLMDDPKYKGKKSSRKAALGFASDEDEEEDDEEEMEFNEDEDDDEEDEEDQDEEMVSDEDDLDDGEDLMGRFDRDGSDDENENDDDEEEEEEEEGDDDEEDSQDEDDDSEDGEDEEDGYGDLTASGITETSKEMQEELQKIQQEETELLKSMTKSVTDDVEKGIHVKAQMTLWETLLDTRIRLQKSVSLINTFPQPSTYDEFLTNDSAEPMEEAKHNLRSFIDTLITVRTDLLRNIPDVKVPKSNKRHMSDLDDEEARNLDDDAWQTKAWKDIEGLDEGWRSYRNNTLEKWSNKVQIASGIPLNKKFKAMNQGIMTQISQTMADKERLLKRTQLKRSEYHILGTAPEIKEEDENDKTEKTPEVSKLDSHLSNHDEEIFDDGDFYQQLLRELIESRMVDNDDPTAMGMRWAALRQTKQTKKQVDTKGSKGRRLRYHVHEKLQSFMAPIPAGTWHEEMIEELFSSLLGRKGGNLDDDEEDENETKEDEEQEDIPDDGLRIFG
ncbi:MAG: apoptosis-antagonizing transcription factor [Linnemannia elongata]|nr:MAG: apoptosis-antagonizing transcription factor [Linnemannia elongata]